jgi:argininosuccinate lyase
VSRLWERGEPVDERVARFCAGRDPEIDPLLVPYDALASAAHATMLAGIGLLDPGELPAVVGELAAIAREAREGRFAVDPADEDGHTAIENRLVDRLGDTGRRIHTGRSRNDQVIAALRLFAREALVELAGEVAAVAGRLIELAEEHRETSLPGYTHTRQAVPATLGLLFAAHAEGLTDAAPWLAAAYDHADRSPLGSAAGYGAPLPLDRRRVSDLLGFARTQHNVLAVQNDRGKTEWLVAGAALAPVADAARLAADLILFSSDELGFVRLATAVTTGSSIMPHKRNPDVLELVRAGAARLRARHAEIGAVVGGLASGYHRDLQLTKEPFLAAMTGAVELMAALGAALGGLEVDRERCRAAMVRAIGATDEVFRRVGEGEPFRTAYRAVAADPEAAVTGDPAESWRLRTHLGAPGALDLAPARRALAAMEDWRRAKAEHLAAVWSLLDR